MNRIMTPFQTMISDALAARMYTEDTPKLEEFEGHYVFVYGLAMGQISSFLVNDNRCLYRGMATTLDRHYRLIEYRGSVKTRYLADPSGLMQIRGELWDLPTEKIFELDVEEHNTMLTQRVRIPIKTEDGQALSAWAYITEKDLIKDNPEKITAHVNIYSPGVVMVKTYPGTH